MQTQSPLSFFESQAVWKVARSIVCIRVLMPIPLRFVATASPIEKYGGGGGENEPAAAARRLSTRDAPRFSSSFSARRSTAVTAARRTRLSAHGDLGSHWSKKSRKWM